jgi:hypothetical protein
MAAQTIKRLAGPAFIASAAANIYSQNALLYDIVRHIHIANNDSVAHNFTLYVGATGGSASGTELFKTFSVAANSTYDWYCNLKLVGAVDFLSGLADTASKLIITVEGESYVI